MFLRVTAIVIVLFVASLSSLAQATASASVSATITTVVGAERGDNMLFSQTDIETLPAGSIGKLTAGKSVITRNSFAASFRIYGSSQVYDIQVPENSISVPDNAGNEKFRIDCFDIKSSGNNSVSDNQEQFKITASLHTVKPINSAVGTNSSSFNVMVNFN